MPVYKCVGRRFGGHASSVFLSCTRARIGGKVVKASGKKRNVTIRDECDEVDEREIFPTKVQIRKIGERRYGKGTINITDKNVYVNFKKFLGKLQSFSFPRSDVAEVEFKVNELPVKLVGPGFSLGSKQTWVIMDIRSKHGVGFNLYVGEL